jgi:hypothetical protein
LRNIKRNYRLYKILHVPELVLEDKVFLIKIYLMVGENIIINAMQIGAIILFGLSNMQIWDVGCLMTSYAMVVTSLWWFSNPCADVAANTGNFSGGSAYFNAPGPSANGHSANYVTNPSLQSLRDALNSGQSVIVGLSADGGPFPQHYSDHWVVLRSVSGDSFNINDPFYAGAMNVPLGDHYSGWTIIEARIYN